MILWYIYGGTVCKSSLLCFEMLLLFSCACINCSCFLSQIMWWRVVPILGGGDTHCYPDCPFPLPTPTLLCSWANCSFFPSDYVMACGPYPEGVWNAVTQSARCAPWVSWGYLNALFHVMWVGALFFCQCYQVRNSLNWSLHVSFMSIGGIF